MMKLYVVCCVIVAVSAYDFGDKDFNLYLSSELNEWSSLERVRRSEDDGPPPHRRGGPPHHHWKSCCGDGRMMKNFLDRRMSEVEECGKEFHDRLNFTVKDDSMNGIDDMFSCSKVNIMKMMVTCTSECAGKKLQVLNEDGSLKPETVRTYTSEAFKDHWVKDIAAAALDQCLNNVKPTMVTTPETGSVKCNSAMLSLKHCLWMNIEKNCPETKRRDDPKCGEFFDRVDAGMKASN